MRAEGGEAMADQDRREFGASAATFLSTEHWFLLGTRSMSWNESFSRMGLFLNTLSAAVVALALVANASGFGRSFKTFALVLFPIVLFLGVTTYIRLVRINIDDMNVVAAMNRLRRAYVEIEPGIAPYITGGTHDDLEGIYDTLLMGRVRPGSVWSHIVVTTPMILLVLNSIIAGAGAAFVVSSAGASGALTGTVAALMGICTALALGGVQARAARQLMNRTVRFPRQEGAA